MGKNNKANAIAIFQVFSKHLLRGDILQLCRTQWDFIAKKRSIHGDKSDAKGHEKVVFDFCSQRKPSSSHPIQLKVKFFNPVLARIVGYRLL